MEGLLDGVRVVDLSRVLAGPFAAQILAEMGADVVKVEPPQGDPARGVGPHMKARSLYFSSLNTGKRGVVLDLASAADRRALDALLASADAVVENFRPEAARRLGCLPADLLRRHPHLVVVSVTGYARESSRAEEGSYDVIAQAESGIMALTGEPERPPVRAGVAVSDLAAGLWAALAVAAGLFARSRDGRGRAVEVPLLDAAVSLLSYVGTAALGTGEEPGPVGSGHHSVTPYGAFRASDGWVVIAVIGDKFWPALCTALDLEDMVGRQELRSNAQRLAARAEVEAAVAERVAALTVDEAVERLQRSGVPHAPVRALLDALAAPYVRERGIVAEVETPEGSYPLIQGPLRSGDAPRPAPALGEHTAAVLDEVLSESPATESE